MNTKFSYFIINSDFESDIVLYNQNDELLFKGTIGELIKSKNFYRYAKMIVKSMFIHKKYNIFWVNDEEVK